MRGSMGIIHRVCSLIGLVITEAQAQETGKSAATAIGIVMYDPTLVFGLIGTILPILVGLFIYRKYIKILNKS